MDYSELTKQLEQLISATNEMREITKKYDLSRNEDDIIVKLFDKSKGFYFEFNKNTNEILRLEIKEDDILKKSNLTIVEFMQIYNTILDVVKPFVIKELELKYPMIRSVLPND